VADRWLCCGRQVQLAMRQMQQAVSNCNISQDRRQDMFCASPDGGKLKKITKSPSSDTPKMCTVTDFKAFYLVFL